MNTQTTSQTFSKADLQDYLGITEYKLHYLLKEDSNFPKPKPYLKRWSKLEIDYWLNPDFFPKQEEGTDVKEFINW